MWLKTPETEDSSKTKANIQSHPSAVFDISGLTITVLNYLIYSRETLQLYRAV